MPDEFRFSNSFDLNAFERELVDAFPTLRKEIEEDEGLLHPHFGSLYRACQDAISRNQWELVASICRFVQSCASRNSADLENAIQVSFLEFFDFQGAEGKIKEMLGPTLVQLYQEHMVYMDDLERLSRSSFKDRIEKRERGENTLFACPCCGYATLSEPGAYEICQICFWEDDGQDDPIADISMGGPNKVSLETGRVNYLKYGASDLKDKDHTRHPNVRDEVLRKYRLDGDRALPDDIEI